MLRFVNDRSSLRRKAVIGFEWLVARSVVRNTLELIKAVVFARVLFPDDYGKMALAAIAIGLLDSFTALGVETMIQRDSEDIHQRISEYWTVKLLRGVLLFSLTWVVSLPLAAFYHRPELVVLVRFLGLSFIFDGLAGFGKEIRQRDMKFAKVAVWESLAGIVLLIVGLVFVIWLRNYWALAVYNVANSFLLMIVSYVIFPWRPRFSFNAQAFRKILVFAGSIILINIFNYMFNYLDKATIGKLLGVDSLGVYSRAYYLAMMPVALLFSNVSPVMMNALRSAVDDPQRLKHAFWESSLAYAGLAAGVGLAFFIFAEPIVAIIYGARWLAAIPIFKILVIYGAFKGFNMVCPPIFFLKRKQWIIWLTTLFMLCVLGAIVLPLTKMFGVIGTAWAVVIAGVTSNSMSFIIVLKLLSIKAEA